MKYYYPNNLSSKALFAKYWNLVDLIVIAVLFTFSVLNVILFGSLWLFVIFASYLFFSAKFINGKSLTKFGILYIRFLITDILVYFWR